MKAPFTVGCLLAISCQVPNFADGKIAITSEQSEEKTISSPSQEIQKLTQQLNRITQLLLSYAEEASAEDKAVVYAEDAPAQDGVVTNSPMSMQNELELASLLTYGVTYSRVHIMPDDHPSFEGNMWGVLASYEYRPYDRIYGGLKLNWKQGDTHGDAGHRYLTDVKVEERIGYNFTFCEQEWQLALFSGFGYRYLGHKLRHTGESTLRFNYNEFYIPVGFLADYEMNSSFSVGFYVTWMPQVYPTVEIVPLKGARWIIKNRYANVEAELPLSYFVTDNLAITLSPFFEYWQDGESTAVTSTGLPLGLPSNSYIFWGADLKLAYSF